jgi:prepilin-type N-terminal cleavage/methylation domain-containing protein
MDYKRLFTLLEIMIALVIISIIGALTAFQVKKMIDAHRFEAEVSDLFIALQEAQVLSAAYQTDLALDIFMEKGKPLYRFSTDEPLPPLKLKQSPVLLSHTAFFKFKDAKTPSLHFDIYSGGRIEPRGSLAFFQTLDDGKVLWFDMQYGQLLKFSYRRPNLVKEQTFLP